MVPWSTLKGEIRHRLGTKSLVDFLGERLSAFMSTKCVHTFPEVRRMTDLRLLVRIQELIGKTSSLLADVNSQLGRLPPPPSSDPIVQLGTLVNGLVADLQGYATGTAGHKSLIQDVGEVLDNFKLDVQATEPRFTPFESSNPKRKQWETTVVAISSSDKGRPVGPGVVASRKRRLEELGNEIDQEGAPAFTLEMDLEQVQHRIKKCAPPTTLEFGMGTADWAMPLAGRGLGSFRKTSRTTPRRTLLLFLFKAGRQSSTPASSVSARSCTSACTSSWAPILRDSTKARYALWSGMWSSKTFGFCNLLFFQNRHVVPR